MQLLLIAAFIYAASRNPASGTKAALDSRARHDYDSLQSENHPCLANGKICTAGSVCCSKYCDGVTERCRSGPPYPPPGPVIPREATKEARARLTKGNSWSVDDQRCSLYCDTKTHRCCKRPPQPPNGPNVPREATTVNSLSNLIKSKRDSQTRPFCHYDGEGCQNNGTCCSKYCYFDQRSDKPAGICKSVPPSKCIENDHECLKNEECCFKYCSFFGKENKGLCKARPELEGRSESKDLRTIRLDIPEDAESEGRSWG